MKIRHLFVSRKSDSGNTSKLNPSDWNTWHVDEMGKISEVIPSSPPPGMFKVVNIYFDPMTGRFAVQYDDGT